MNKSSIFEIAIRKATLKDVDTILRIWQEADLPHKPKGRDTKENLIAQLQLPQIKVFIASLECNDVAIVMVTHDGRKGWLNRLAVLKKYRKRGIAYMLIIHSERWLASQGIKIYSVLIEEPNNASKNLFSKAGYTRHDDVIYFTKKTHSEV